MEKKKNEKKKKETKKKKVFKKKKKKDGGRVGQEEKSIQKIFPPLGTPPLFLYVINMTSVHETSETKKTSEL